MPEKCLKPRPESGLYCLLVPNSLDSDPVAINPLTRSRCTLNPMLGMVPQLCIKHRALNATLFPGGQSQ